MAATDVVLILGAVGVLLGQIAGLIILLRNDRTLSRVDQNVNGHSARVDALLEKQTGDLRAARLELRRR